MRKIRKSSSDRDIQGGSDFEYGPNTIGNEEKIVENPHRSLPSERSNDKSVETQVESGNMTDSYHHHHPKLVKDKRSLTSTERSHNAGEVRGQHYNRTEQAAQYEVGRVRNKKVKDVRKTWTEPIRSKENLTKGSSKIEVCKSSDEETIYGKKTGKYTGPLRPFPEMLDEEKSFQGKVLETLRPKTDSFVVTDRHKYQYSVKDTLDEKTIVTMTEYLEITSSGTEIQSNFSSKKSTCLHSKQAQTAVRDMGIGKYPHNEIKHFGEMLQKENSDKMTDCLGMPSSWNKYKSDYPKELSWCCNFYTINFYGALLDMYISKYKYLVDMYYEEMLAKDITLGKTAASVLLKQLEEDKSLEQYQYRIRELYTPDTAKEKNEYLAGLCKDANMDSQNKQTIPMSSDFDLFCKQCPAKKSEYLMSTCLHPTQAQIRIHTELDNNFLEKYNTLVQPHPLVQVLDTPNKYNAELYKVANQNWQMDQTIRMSSDVDLLCRPKQDMVKKVIHFISRTSGSLSPEEIAAMLATNHYKTDISMLKSEFIPINIDIQHGHIDDVLEQIVKELRVILEEHRPKFDELTLTRTHAGVVILAVGVNFKNKRSNNSKDSFVRVSFFLATSVMFHDALYFAYEVTFTNIYPEDIRMFLALPVRVGGFFDLIDRKHRVESLRHVTTDNSENRLFS